MVMRSANKDQVSVLGWMDVLDDEGGGKERGEEEGIGRRNRKEEAVNP